MDPTWSQWWPSQNFKLLRPDPPIWDPEFVNIPQTSALQTLKKTEYWWQISQTKWKKIGLWEINNCIVNFYQIQSGFPLEISKMSWGLERKFRDCVCLLSLVEVKQDKFKLHLLELKQNYLGAGSHSNCILLQTINIEENWVKYQILTSYFDNDTK